MEKKQSLKQQFESMGMGETIVTDANRQVVFVNAKRAGVIVKTKKLDSDRLEVTMTGRTEVPEVEPDVKIEVLMANLDADSRLDLLSYFSAVYCGKCGEKTTVCDCGVAEPADNGGWLFIYDPEYADNGQVYRKQYRIVNEKPVYRRVRVDSDDVTRIIGD